MTGARAGTLLFLVASLGLAVPSWGDPCTRACARMRAQCRMAAKSVSALCRRNCKVDDSCSGCPSRQDGVQYCRGLLDPCASACRAVPGVTRTTCGAEASRCVRSVLHDRVSCLKGCATTQERNAKIDCREGCASSVEFEIADCLQDSPACNRAARRSYVACRRRCRGSLCARDCLNAYREELRVCREHPKVGLLVCLGATPP
jgi:hypothetical protein